jgi:hypothetical protein
MNTRALAALAVLSLSALAACSATGGTPANYAANHSNSAVMSDAVPGANADVGVAAMPDTDPVTHAFIGGWWKDHD